MNHRGSLRFPCVVVAMLSVFLVVPRGARADFDLSDNLSQASTGTEAAIGSNWLTSSFGTDGSSYKLSSITLLLANSVAGKAELDLYSDGGLEPGSLVGVLASPTAYSSTLANTTFTASGITLGANSTYWVVLHATSGEFDWSWTDSDLGTGVGFQDSWGQSTDAGVSWFTFDDSPVQMSVIATQAVPEPASLVLCGLGAASLWLCRRGKPRIVSHD